jgi:hypothetical protein
MHQMMKMQSFGRTEKKFKFTQSSQKKFLTELQKIAMSTIFEKFWQGFPPFLLSGFLILVFLT